MKPLENQITRCRRKYEECCRRRDSLFDKKAQTWRTTRNRHQKHHHEALKWLFKWRNAEKMLLSKIQVPQVDGWVSDPNGLALYA